MKTGGGVNWSINSLFLYLNLKKKKINLNKASSFHQIKYIFKYVIKIILSMFERNEKKKKKEISFIIGNKTKIKENKILIFFGYMKIKLCLHLIIILCFCFYGLIIRLTNQLLFL